MEPDAPPPADPCVPERAAITPAPVETAIATAAPGETGVVRVRRQRWMVLRDLVVFQAKLLLDGIKDLVLVPASIVVGIYGLLSDRDEPGRSFYGLLAEARRFDRWVDLFGALPAEQNAPEPAPDAVTAALPPEGLDGYVRRLERVLVEQYERGGLTAKAKDALDDALDRLHERR